MIDDHRENASESPNSGENVVQCRRKSHFQDLPVEIQIQIFSYFSPVALSTTIAPVCKHWWMISKDACLWKNVSFSISQDESSEIYCNILQRCHLLHTLRIKSTIQLNQFVHCFAYLSFLKILDIGFCKGLNATSFLSIVSNCPLIEDLNLEGCHPGVEYQGICNIVSLTHLRDLNLSHCVAVDDTCVKTIARGCHKLQLLNIDGITRITDDSVCELAKHRYDTLEHLFVDGEELTDESMIWLSTCQKLMTLKVSFGELLTDESLKVLASLPCLGWFKLRRSPNLTTDALQNFFDNSKLLNLMDLEIDSLSIDDRGLQNLARTCRNLRSLSLPWCWEITDEGLKSIIDNCNRLYWLDLLGLYQLMGESLIHIPTKLPNLRYLNLEQCNSIVDDIVKDLARKMPQLRVFSYYGDQVLPSDSEDEATVIL